MTNHPNHGKVSPRRLVAYYWPKPGGHINSFQVQSLDDAREKEAAQRREAALIWDGDSDYDRKARGNYPRVIALVSYPLGLHAPKRTAPDAERIEWEEFPGALNQSGAGWHIAR